jgi:hypothetical protein
VAYLSTDLGVLASYFYFIAHTACYCMGAIRLDGMLERYQYLIQIGRGLDQTRAPLSTTKVINMHSLNNFFQLPSASTIIYSNAEV